MEWIADVPHLRPIGAIVCRRIAPCDSGGGSNGAECGAPLRRCRR
jgi:hypothetical protein